MYLLRGYNNKYVQIKGIYTSFIGYLLQIRGIKITLRVLM